MESFLESFQRPVIDSGAVIYVMLAMLSGKKVKEKKHVGHCSDNTSDQ
jgi:hypothetical protein